MHNFKTLDVTAKQWFDKVNGNSYFSAKVVLDYGLPNERTYKIPFEYGYGNYYEQATVQTLIDNKELNVEGFGPALWQLKEQGVIVRSHKETGCKKRDVVAFGK